MSAILGSLEEMILLSMESKRGLGTVTGTREHLKRAGVIMAGGAIDQTLRRLEKKGLVGSELVGTKKSVRWWFLTQMARDAMERAENVRIQLRA